MRVYSFLFGMINGIYLAQNYDIPDLKNMGEKALDYLKSMEKK